MATQQDFVDAATAGFAAVAEVRNSDYAELQDAKSKAEAADIKADAAASFTVIDRAITFSGEFELTPLGYGQAPPEGVYYGPKTCLSYDTLVSTPVGGADLDNQRAMLLIRGRTNDDGNSEEQLIQVMYDMDKGYAGEFKSNHAYTEGENFMVGSANAIYRVVQGGVSGSTPPSGRVTGIANGTLVVDWINDAAIGAKLPLYMEGRVWKGAGSSWMQVNNMDIQSGCDTDFICNTELDLTNHSGFDSGFGFKNKIGLWVAGQGPNRSTCGIQVSSANTANHAFLWGQYFAGGMLASNSVIGIDASAPIGIGSGPGAGGAITPTFATAFIRDKSITPTCISAAGTYSSSQISLPQGGGAPAAIAISGTKTLATYLDLATSPIALDLQGANATAAIQVSGVTPAAFVSTGYKSFAGFFDSSTAPVGLRLNGTYDTAQITGNSWAVLPDGRVDTPSLLVKFTNAPASQTAPGVAGEVRFDQQYMYVCVNTNSWRRVPLPADW